MVTKVKVFFLVLVYVFKFDFFEFSTTILEKGLLLHLVGPVDKIYFLVLFFQRVALFHAYSMSAMCKAGFDVIDVYSLTDSYPPRCIDHVHYTNNVFYMVETMLEQYKVNSNKKLDENEKHGKLKRCISKENF